MSIRGFAARAIGRLVGRLSRGALWGYMHHGGVGYAPLWCGCHGCKKHLAEMAELRSMAYGIRTAAEDDVSARDALAALIAPNNAGGVHLVVKAGNLERARAIAWGLKP